MGCGTPVETEALSGLPAHRGTGQGTCCWRFPAGVPMVGTPRSLAGLSLMEHEQHHSDLRS